MSKIHFLIGATSTEAVSVDQTVLVMLPETIRPAVVPTYAGQLQAGVKALVRLGSEKNLFTNHFLPCVGAVDQNIFLAKRRDLELTESEVESLRGDVWKRAGVFIAYLISHHLIDRKLYPVLEKHRRQAPLTSKDLNSLVDMACAFCQSHLRFVRESDPSHHKRFERSKTKTVPSMTPRWSEILPLL